MLVSKYTITEWVKTIILYNLNFFAECLQELSPLRSHFRKQHKF